MACSNINAVLDMVEQYLEGKMSRITSMLDFPYEAECGCLCLSELT